MDDYCELENKTKKYGNANVIKVADLAEKFGLKIVKIHDAISLIDDNLLVKENNLLYAYYTEEVLSICEKAKKEKINGIKDAVISVINSQNPNENILTITQACIEKNVTRTTIYSWIEKGRIDYVKIKERMYVLKNEKYDIAVPIRGPIRKESMHESLEILKRKVDKLEKHILNNNI